MTTVNWLTEMLMEDSTFMDPYQMDSLQVSTQQPLPGPGAFEENYHCNYSSESFSSFPASLPCSDTDAMQAMTTDRCWNSCNAEPLLSTGASSPSDVISFRLSNSPSNHQQFSGIPDGTIKHNDEQLPPKSKKVPSDFRISQGTHVDQNYPHNVWQENKAASTTSSKTVCTQDHIIAERKRREKLNQRFKALSAIVPGIMKMDKASILEYTTAYLKHLQERVKTLEEKSSKKTMESMVFVKKTQSVCDSNSCSTDESFSNLCHEPLLEIDIKVSDRNVLLQIHCENLKGVLVKIVTEIEKLKLSVVHSSIVPFGNSILNITISAQMNEEFNLTAKDLVKELRAALVERK